MKESQQIQRSEIIIVCGLIDLQELINKLKTPLFFTNKTIYLTYT